MRPIRPFPLVAPLALGLGPLAPGGREGRRHERPDAGRPPAPVVARDSRVFIEEAIRLYAAGQFPRTCERFSRTADNNPTSAALRVNISNYFEGWGWQALREGRPDEALLLFRQGLVDAPESTTLLKGLGLAAVHAGRPDDAFVPLERAVRAEFDPEVRVLLAHLYDSRDDPARAIAHLRAVLEREPDNAGALRLLEKVERERRAESGFHRDVTPRFVLKYRGAPGTEARRTILGLLEVAAERVDRALRWEPRERPAVVLYERGQFQDVTRVHGWATGLFDGKIVLPIGPALPPAAQVERLIVHEYAHAAIHHLSRGRAPRWLQEGLAQALEGAAVDAMLRVPGSVDRKSTRLNSSHITISYAVFCLKKKTTKKSMRSARRGTSAPPRRRPQFPASSRHRCEAG